MKRLARQLLAFALLICIALTLVGCSGTLGGNGGTNSGSNADTNGNGDGNNTAPPDETPIYRIAYANSDIDIADLRNNMIRIQGTVSSVSASDNEPVDMEIVIGDTSREITEKAKSALKELISESSYDTGYIVYAEGNNVAVYWGVASLESAAISAFISECLSGDEVLLTEGVISHKLSNKSEAQWLEIEETYGKEVVTALKSLYSYYQGPKIAAWLANLYDPEIGGFYYSRSARDYEGFLPDLESTQQAFGILVNLGAMPQSKITELLPDEMKDKIADFARNMQSAEDGYFYHPQWPYGRENLNIDRYGRDQGNATSILNRMAYDRDGDGVVDKQYPYYCTVDGTKCALHDGTESSCSFPVSVGAVSSRVDSSVGISRPLSSDVCAAVSYVSNSVVHATAASSHPDYSSKAAFLAWLKEYNKDIHINSGGAHNLAGIIDEIKANGCADVLLDYLDEQQEALFNEQEELGETPTGTWQRPIDYKNVWGTFKYMHIYNDVGRAINLKYASYMVETCIKVIELPADGNYAYNDLMNQWSAITSVISNVRKFYGEDEAEKLHEIVRRDPVPLIDNSLEKMLPFRQEDGSFSNNVNGTTSGSIYGVPIAIGGIAEGNVNSTHILLSMYSSICTALGCPKVPLCDTKEALNVAEIMTNCEPIEKVELEKEVFDFEDAEISDMITLSKNNEGAEVTVVDDPTGDDNLVLQFISPSSATSGDTLNVNISGAGGNGYIFHSKLYVSSESSGGTILQLRFSNTYMLQIKKSGTAITLQEASSINGDNVNDVASLNSDEWFDLYIEYYANGDSNGLEVPAIKIWINGEYVMTSSNYYGSHNSASVINTACTALNLLSLRSPATNIYLDDVELYKETLTFDPDDTDYPF